MSIKKTRNKLEEIAGTISGLQKNADDTGTGDYEFSAVYSGPRKSQITGLWKIAEHTVDGRDYLDVFCAGNFRDVLPVNMTYDATYEFTQNLCIKRVLVCGELNLSDEQADGIARTVLYEYRMNMVLSWQLAPLIIRVQPVIGYQYSSLDGKPAAVKDLPPTDAWLGLSVRFENGCMILEDGTDIKRLVRVE
jgi:hypothetical protein